MTTRLIVAAALVALAGCAEVLDENRVTRTLPAGEYYGGEPYDVVTQTIQGPNGPYQRTRVVYWGRSAPCILDSPRDCDLAARRLIDQRFSVGGF